MAEADADETFDIIVSGHICLDLIPDLSGVPPGALGTPGRLMEAGPISISTGGTVSNTGLGLHRLGVRVGLMSTVGDDVLGEVIIAFLKDHDPRLSQLITVQTGQQSSYSIVLAPRDRDRSFIHCPGTNATFDAEHIHYAMVSRAQVFHLGYPPVMPRLIADSGRELRAIYQQVKAAGVITSMDMTMPDPDGPSGRADWLAILRRALPFVDIFLPSIHEAVFMLRRADFDSWRGDVLAHLNRNYVFALAGELIDMGVVVAGFKLGEMGLYLRTAPDCARLRRLPIKPSEWADREYWHPALDVSVASATGAGDAAYAGFLAALLRGFAPEACARWACAVGACACEQIDATSGIRTWEATQVRLDSGWNTLGISLPGYAG